MTEATSESKSLAGRIALVTGGCGGLGQATARRLKRDGATVIISDLDAAQGQSIADELGVQFLAQDVSDVTAWQAAVEQITAEHGALDILVNNAAILRADNIESETLEQFQRVMAVNCESVFFGHTALPAADVSPRCCDHQCLFVLRGEGLPPLRCLHRVQGGGAEFDDEHGGVSQTAG